MKKIITIFVISLAIFAGWITSVFGIHFCSDEISQLLGAIPFIGDYAQQLLVWYQMKNNKEDCHHEHEEK